MFINLSDSPFSTIDPRTGDPYHNWSNPLANPIVIPPPPPPPPPPPVTKSTGWNTTSNLSLPKPPTTSPGTWYTQNSAGNFVAQPKPAANAVVNDPEWGPVYAATGLPVNSTGSTTATNSSGGSSFYNPNISITQQKWFLPVVVLGGAFIVYKMFKKRQAQ